MNWRLRLLQTLSTVSFILGAILAMPGLFLLIGAAQLSTMAIGREPESL